MHDWYNASPHVRIFTCANCHSRVYQMIGSSPSPGRLILKTVQNDAFAFKKTKFDTHDEYLTCEEVIIWMIMLK